MADFHLVGNVLANCSVMVYEVEQEIARSADLQRTECDGLRLLDVFDGKTLALGDDVLTLGQRLAVECRLHTIHYIIYRAFAEQGNEQSREETRQPTSLSRLRDVAFAAMFPLPNLLGYEEAIEEEEYFVLQLLEPTLLGYIVERKYVDVDALMHLDVLERGFREAGAVYADLHKVERRVGLCVWSLQEEAFAQLLLRHFGKTLIVWSHHAYIHVVVPRQNLLPEVRANSRSACHEVTDAVLFADAIHFGKRSIESALKLLKFLLLIIHRLIL